MKRSRPRRGMSETTRAFHALQGRTFPRIGDRGLYKQGFVTAVEVVDVTASGLTVTVRFIRSAPRKQFGLTFRVHRRGDLFDGTGWYLPNGRVFPGGEVSFSPSGFEAPE